MKTLDIPGKVLVNEAVSKLDEILHLAMDRMEARMSGEQTEDGVETHFTELDRMMGGFHANELLQNIIIMNDTYITCNVFLNL